MEEQVSQRIKEKQKRNKQTSIENNKTGSCGEPLTWRDMPHRMRENPLNKFEQMSGGTSATKKECNKETNIESNKRQEAVESYNHLKRHAT